MKKREEWGTRTGFILAAVGSAIGLGNIWRFPYVTYENHGGTFLIPYFFALLTAGIPLLILEFGLGHKFRAAAPSVFARMTQFHKININWEWLGWFQTFLSFVISTYYTVVIGWTVGYLGLSLFSSSQQGWGNDTGSFFTHFLGKDGLVTFYTFTPWVPFLTIFVWGICFIILAKGVKSGVEKANKIFIPILIILVLLITIRSLFLDGAASGLNLLFKPDFKLLFSFTQGPKIWVAAYGQIFFSLSVGFAVMISYSSYLPKKSDIVNNAFITGFLNCGFSMISGIMIFSILGYMAHQTEGKSVADVVTQKAGLAFITIPQVLNSLPGITGRIIGPLFFLALTFAGLSSAISIMEATVRAITDKFQVSRILAITIVTVTGLTFSILFSSNAGSNGFDITDKFVNNIGILMSGICEIILLAWFSKLKLIQNHINLTSDFKAGGWWTISITFITPLSLFYILIWNIINSFQEETSIFYMDSKDLIMNSIFGICMILTILMGSIMLHFIKGHPHHLTGHELDFNQENSNHKKEIK